MELKLGEVLLREKLITTEQLEEALNSQTVYGIRLGSTLVEMGYVEEDALAHVLGAKLGVPVVGSDELSSISRDVIRDFSRALVVRYHVMPFKLERNRLGLAMSNPNDLKAIEEIAFITGHVVQPYIAPDVRISHAQAKYYRVSDGEARYQHVAEERLKKDAGKPEAGKTVAVSAMTETGEMVNVHIPAEFEDFASLNDATKTDEGTQTQPGGQPVLYDSICMEFTKARTRDDVAETLIRYIAREFKTGMFFVLRGAIAAGWRGVINGALVDDVRSLSLMLSKTSVLRDVIETKTFSLGPLQPTPENRRVLEVLSLPEDTPLFAAPVVMLNKVVVVVLVLADVDDLGRKLQELQQLLKKVAMAFEMLIIRSKILLP